MPLLFFFTNKKKRIQLICLEFHFDKINRKQAGFRRKTFWHRIQSNTSLVYKSDWISFKCCELHRKKEGVGGFSVWQFSTKDPKYNIAICCTSAESFPPYSTTQSRMQVSPAVQEMQHGSFKRPAGNLIFTSGNNFSYMELPKNANHVLSDDNNNPEEKSSPGQVTGKHSQGNPIRRDLCIRWCFQPAGELCYDA